MDLDQLPERLTGAVSHLRDRTADAVGVEGSIGHGELVKIGRKLDRLEASIGDQVEASCGLLAAQFSDILADRRRTTWPRKFFWLAVGAGVGAAVMYLRDPDRGSQRWNEFNDQVVAKGRKSAEDLKIQAKGAVKRARGQVIETVKDILPNQPEDDAGLLEQRIRSEVFGHRSDTEKVVLRIDGPGKVALKGTVPTSVSEKEILASVAEVHGVTEVVSELNVEA